MVKTAKMVIYQILFVKRALYQMCVKIELTSKNREIVGGKKNGKIDKVRGQSRLSLTYCS